ncbi:MAG: hypothetical protein WBW47_03345 [Thermoplasmata archaeon]
MLLREPRRTRAAAVTAVWITVASILLSGTVVAVRPSMEGPADHAQSVHSTAAITPRSNHVVTDAAWQNGFDPSTVPQSTLSFTNDTLVPGNRQPFDLIGPDMVAAVPGLGELLVGSPNALVAVGASDGSLLWQTQIGIGTIAVDSAGGVAFVGNGAGIAEVALSNGSVLARHGVDVYSASPIAFDPVSNLLYLTQVGTQEQGILTYYASNLTEDEWLPGVTTGANPTSNDVAVDPNTGAVFVTFVPGWGGPLVGPQPVEFSVLAAHGSFVGQSFVCGPAASNPFPTALAFDSRNNTVFVLCDNSSGASLYVESAITAQTVAVVPLPLGWMEWPWTTTPLTYVPQTDTIVIGNGEGGLTQVDATSYRIQTNTVLSFDGGATVALAADGSTGLVYGVNPFSDQLNAYDATLATRVLSRQFAAMPLAPTYVPPSEELWVAGVPNANSVSIINTSLAEVVGSVGVGFVPDAMGYDSVHSNMWVANALSSNLSVVNEVTQRVVATVALAAHPVSIAVAPTIGEIFVAGSSGNVSPTYSTAATLTAINDTTFAVEGIVNLALPKNMFNNYSTILPTSTIWDSGIGRVIVGDAYGFSADSQGSYRVGFWSIDPVSLNTSVTPTPMEAYITNDLEYDVSTGTLYATGWLSGDSANETLWRVNPSNGTNEGIVGNLSTSAESTEYSVPGSETGGVGVNILPLAGTPWVAVALGNGSTYKLSFFNVSSSGPPVVSFSMGDWVLGLAWNPSAGDIFGANYGSGSLSWFGSAPSAPGNPSSQASFVPLAVLFVAFAGMGSALGVVILKRSRKP